jgi:hypothetical protein
MISLPEAGLPPEALPLEWRRERILKIKAHSKVADVASPLSAGADVRG